MARVQRIESDSAFSNANVLQGTILTYKTFQDGRVVHKAKLSNGSVVEITPEVDFSPYYTKDAIDRILSDSYYDKEEINTIIDSLSNSYYNKGQIDRLLQQFSNSADLTDYYTKDEVDAIIRDLSNSLSTLQTRVSALQGSSGASGVLFIPFSQIDQQGYANFTGYGVPVGIIAPSGTYYPIQKLSLQINTTTGVVGIHMVPYLAYQNAQSFSGVWICCFPKAANLVVVVSSVQPSNPIEGTIWIQSE